MDTAGGFNSGALTTGNTSSVLVPALASIHNLHHKHRKKAKKSIKELRKKHARR
jgi:hypothetical protein